MQWSEIVADPALEDWPDGEQSGSLRAPDCPRPLS